MSVNSSVRTSSACAVKTKLQWKSNGPFLSCRSSGAPVDW